MTTDPEFYQDCVFYPLTTRISKVQFRYDTEPFVDKFCIPTVKQANSVIEGVVGEF
jgi:hypothetical protein